MADRRDRELGPTMPAIFLGAVAANRLARQGENRPARALELAKTLKVQGATADQIHRQTSALLDGTPYAGVHYGADGLPRFELSDRDSKSRPVKLDKSGRGFQGDALAHPELYRIYPEAELLQFEKRGKTGAGYTGDTVIMGEDNFASQQLAGRHIQKPTARGMNLHELQHFVQQMEGFAPGGTPDQFKDRLPGAKNEKLRVSMYKSLAGEVEAENARRRAEMKPEERRVISPLKTQAIHNREQIVTDQSGGLQEEFGGDLPKGYDVQRNTDGSRVNYKVFKGREHVGNAYIRDLGDRVQMDLIDLDDKHQRKGIATALYAKIERDYGKPIVPDEQLSAKALKFWQKHRPEQVKSHIVLSDGSAVLDPQDAQTFERRLAMAKAGKRMQAMFGGDLPKGYSIDKRTNSLGQSTYRILKGRKQVGEAYVRDLRDRVQVGRISIDDKHQRKGIATALYAQIEADAGKPLVPDGTLSPKAAEFWRKHRPEALLEHRPLGDGSLMVDPLGLFTKGRLQQMVSTPRSRKAAVKIDDIGEKIGGARKDTAVKTGPKRAKSTVVDDRPAWARRFKITEQLDPRTYKPTGTYNLVDAETNSKYGGRTIARGLASPAEAEKMIPLAAVSRNHNVRNIAPYGQPPQYQIWREVTDRKRVQVIKQDFPTREAAMEFMANNAQKIIETKTAYGEEIFARPEKVMRQGPQYRKGPVKGPEFVKELGFRGVEFGNWNNQAERAEVMNHAYDAMKDLGRALGVKPDSLTLKNQLGLAFGARGHGGKNAAAAHYERDYGAINLTKMSGAGSLAHEWAHAFDHFLRRVDNPRLQERVKNSSGDLVFNASQRTVDMATHGFLHQGQAPEAVKTAMKSLMQTMYSKPVQYTEDATKAEKFAGAAKDNVAEHIASIRKGLERKLEYGKRFVNPATAEQLKRFDELTAKITSGEALQTDWKTFPTPKGNYGRGGITARYSNDVIEQMSSLYKEVRGRSGFDGQNHRGPLDELAREMNRAASRNKMLAEAAAQSVKTKNVPTSFAMEARKLDEGRVSDYWKTEHEMFARAFSSYVEDKMKVMGQSSDFLSFGSDNKYYQIFGMRPFPEGAERETINRAMQNLIDQTKAAGLLQAADPEAPEKVVAPKAEKAPKAAKAPKAKKATGKPVGWSDAARQASAEVRQAPAAPAVESAAVKAVASGSVKKAAAALGTNPSRASEIVKAWKAGKITAENIDKIAAMAKSTKTQAMVDRPVPLGAGMKVRTVSGRELDNVPKFSFGSERKTLNSLKKMDAWLHSEAVAEAKATGNDWNQTLLKAINPKRMSDSDRASVNLLLFGDPDGPSRSMVSEPAPKVAAPKSSLQTAAKEAGIKIPSLAGMKPERMGEKLMAVAADKSTAAGQKAMWEDADRRSRSLMTQYAETQRGPNPLTDAERTKLADKRPEYEFMRPKGGKGGKVGFQNQAVLNAALQAQGKAEAGKAKVAAPAPKKVETVVERTPTRGRNKGKTITERKVAWEAEVNGKPQTFSTRKAALSALGTALDKTGRVAMIAAPVLAGAAAYYGTKDAAQAAGVDSKTATTEAAKAAAVATGTVAAAMAVVGAGLKVGLKAVAKVAPAAAGPAGWAIAGGLTAYGAYEAYKIHKDSGRGLQAAALSIVGADAALHLVKKEAEPTGTKRNLSAGPQRLTGQQTQEFKAAKDAHAAMKELTPAPTKAGWSDQARIAAYEERMNRAGKVAEHAPYSGAPRR